MEPLTFADAPDELLPDALRAIRAVLLEIHDIFSDHRHAIVVAGGLTPSLLLPADASGLYRATNDIDLVLDLTLLQAAADDSQPTLGESLLQNLYQQIPGQQFRWERRVWLPNRQKSIAVPVDLLTPVRYGLGGPEQSVRRRVRDVHEIDPAPLKGVDLALLNPVTCLLSGTLPNGIERRENVPIRVVDLALFIAIKAVALDDRLQAHQVNTGEGHDRHAAKHAYDIDECIARFPGGLTALADRLRPYRTLPAVADALQSLAMHFATADSAGPARLVEEERHRFEDSDILAIVRQSASRRVGRLIRAIND
ncbi:MAG: hypothetical protein V4671_20940 [Armatimonadota bacterium]